MFIYGIKTLPINIMLIQFNIIFINKFDNFLNFCINQFKVIFVLVKYIHDSIFFNLLKLYLKNIK